MVKRIGYLIILCMALLCCGCEAKQSGEDEEVTWSKHAFLLEDEDIFFASMPDNWKIMCRQYHYLVYVPTEGAVSRDLNGEYCAFTVTERIEDEVELPGGKQNQNAWIKEDFAFADGQKGERYDLHDCDNNQWEDTEWENMTSGIHSIRIDSPHEKYKFGMYFLTNLQYEKYQKYSGEFYESMIFQNAQIGLAQTESLKNRDKVRLHAYLESLGLDVTVPEGIKFHISDMYGDWLILNLDTGWVRIVYDPDPGEIAEDFAEERGKVLTDETYEEGAAYAVYNLNGYVYYLYGFIHPEPVYAWIQVSEDDEEMLEVALDIVRSIKFR